MTGAGDRPVYLVGFMGSGKSAVGAALARRRGWIFADTDQMVEARLGATVRELFRRDGEAVFREHEFAALVALGAAPRHVVATGGGLFARAAARRLMARNGLTVWLDAAASELLRRVGPGDGRPLWDAGDPVSWRMLLERRRAAYALAALRVAPRGLDPESLAAQLDQLIQERDW